ncbi:nucleoside hydrolase [Microbacterium sp. NPDC003461]
MTSTPNRTRVLISTDAKNEADDQFAIVHALLSPTLDIRGILPAHFGNARTPDSLGESRREVDLLLKLTPSSDAIRIADGSPTALPDERTAIDSAAARLIIEESLTDDSPPLFIAVLGPLTDVASALLLEPSIADRDITVVWIGGPPYDDIEAVYWPEYNLSNDVNAANVVFASGVTLWQLPMNVYTLVGVGYAELDAKVRPHGEVGAYLVRQLLEWNASNMGRAVDFRSLGDSPAIGVILNPFGAVWKKRIAPRFAPDGSMIAGAGDRRIRVCERVDTRYLLADFFAKIRQAESERRHPPSTTKSAPDAQP